MEGWKSDNSSCIKYRHNWILTTSDDFRSCERSECEAVERFINGSWVLVSQKVTRDKKKKNSNLSAIL
jgi:hypothetical protein